MSSRDGRSSVLAGGGVEGDAISGKSSGGQAGWWPPRAHGAGNGGRAAGGGAWPPEQSRVAVRTERAVRQPRSVHRSVYGWRAGKLNNNTPPGPARREPRGPRIGSRAGSRGRARLTLTRPRGAHGAGVLGGRAAAAAAGGWRRHGGEGAPGASSRSGSVASSGSGSRRGRGCCRGARRAQQSGGRRRRRERLPPVPARAAAAAASSSGADKGGAEGRDGGGGRGRFTGAGRRAAVAALLSLLSCGDRERELCLRRRQNPP